MVALGEGANSTSYDWAIVSSGPPSVAGEGGCRYAEVRGDFLSARRLLAGPTALPAVPDSPPASLPSPSLATPQPMASGLWLFSRNPDNPEAEAEMMALLEEWGVDTSILLPVEHEGCTYEG